MVPSIYRKKGLPSQVDVSIVMYEIFYSFDYFFYPQNMHCTNEEYKEETRKKNSRDTSIFPSLCSNCFFRNFKFFEQKTILANGSVHIVKRS